MTQWNRTDICCPSCGRMALRSYDEKSMDNARPLKANDLLRCSGCNAAFKHSGGELVWVDRRRVIPGDPPRLGAMTGGQAMLCVVAPAIILVILAIVFGR